MADMQRLKKAEEEATKRVERARQERAQLLKKAKEEAKDEIAKYRAKVFADLDEQQAKEGDQTQALAELEVKTTKDIETLKADVAKAQQSVVERLLQVTTTVNLDVPEARKGVRTK